MADEINRKFLATGAPFVTIKYAQSLDGRIATSTGDSRWISSPATLKLAHILRRDHDAVMVGIGTVLKDDPRLDVRLVRGQNPLRVIIDSRLRIPLSSNVLSDENPHQTIIIAAQGATASRVKRIEKAGASAILVHGDSRRVNLSEALAALGRRGVRSVLVEGGSAIITSLLTARLADRIVVVTAPKIIGRGTEAIGDLGLTQLGQAIEFSSVEVQRRGRDVVFDCRF